MKNSVEKYQNINYFKGFLINDKDTGRKNLLKTK